VDLSRLDSGALQMVSELTFAATGACGLGARHQVHCACRLCGVAHVPALGARSRVLRENVPGYRLPDCGYVGPDEDVGFFEGGCMSHLARFGIWPIVAHVNVMRYCGEFSFTLVV
jgi:predicted RNA-binding Zn-ribbon protein involved in translation (DUF1610 family)